MTGVVYRTQTHLVSSLTYIAQALNMLKSDALAEVKRVHGEDLLVLVEGRVGIIERKTQEGTMSTSQYLKELKDAGALGAVVAGGLALDGSDSAKAFESLQNMIS